MCRTYHNPNRRTPVVNWFANLCMKGSSLCSFLNISATSRLRHSFTLIKKTGSIAVLFLLISQASYSVTTYTSKNNYTGSWETSTTWTPVWPTPLTSGFNYNITINGYISCNEALSFIGTSDTLVVNDTLIIQGDLTLGNNSNLIVGPNGILIVRGNLNAGNQTNVIKNSGYIIVTGDFTKTGVLNQGSFTSLVSPTQKFFGGTIVSGIQLSGEQSLH